MNTEDALEFLRAHQPLPATGEISDEILSSFDAVVRHFTCVVDDRSVGLLLNSFGEGDGHGVYVTVEDALKVQDPDIVRAELIKSLKSLDGAVRYWSAQIAASFPDDSLASPLAEILAEGTIDEKIAAATALVCIGTSTALDALSEVLKVETDSRVRELIKEVVQGAE